MIGQYMNWSVQDWFNISILLWICFLSFLFDSVFYWLNDLFSYIFKYDKQQLATNAISSDDFSYLAKDYFDLGYISIWLGVCFQLTQSYLIFSVNMISYVFGALGNKAVNA